MAARDAIFCIDEAPGRNVDVRTVTWDDLLRPGDATRFFVRDPLPRFGRLGSQDAGHLISHGSDERQFLSGIPRVTGQRRHVAGCP